MRLCLSAALAVAITLVSSAGHTQSATDPVFSPDRIRADVTFLADDKLEGRFTASTGYFTAAAYVAERFDAMGIKPGGDVEKWFQLVPVSLSNGRTVRTYRVPNVIGVIPGSDPVLKDEYVVISAHLDHIGKEGFGGGDVIYNGAMDNASGVATMLEAARAFTTDGKPPRRSIMFVALAAEEQGLLGSSHLARNPPVGKGRMIANVNLDMPILLYDFQDVVAFGAEHSTMGPIVAAAAAKMEVTLSRDPMPRQNLFFRSDQFSFVKAGIPSVFLVPGFKNGGDKAFRSFENSHYHRVSDDLSLPFDWNAAAKFARLNYLIAREIADGDQAPLWYAGNTYGNRYAKKAPKAPQAQNSEP